MPLIHTTGSEDTIIELASDNRNLVGDLIKIIERLDCMIVEKNEDMERLEHERDGLNDEIETLKEKIARMEADHLSSV